MSSTPLAADKTPETTTSPAAGLSEGTGLKQKRIFKPRLHHLYPILASFGMTGVLGYPIFASGLQTPYITSFPGDTPTGAGLNALIFVITLTVSATAMLFLVKKRKKRALQGLVKAGLVLMSFVVSLWYGSSIIAIVGASITDEQLLLISVAVAAGLALLVYSKNKTLQAVGVTSLGASTGLFLGTSIPLLTALAIVIALVVYDTVSVFKGPLGALAKNVEISDLTGAVFNYKELTIGMGDIVFYSLLETVALVNFGVAAFVAAGVGVIIGAYLGFRALTRFQIFPGLPFALLLGSGAMLAVALIQGTL